MPASWSVAGNRPSLGSWPGEFTGTVAPKPPWSLVLAARGAACCLASPLFLLLSQQLVISRLQPTFSSSGTDAAGGFVLLCFGTSKPKNRQQLGSDEASQVQSLFAGWSAKIRHREPHTHKVGRALIRAVLRLRNCRLYIGVPYSVAVVVVGKIRFKVVACADHNPAAKSGGVLVVSERRGVRVRREREGLLG